MVTSAADSSATNPAATNSPNFPRKNLTSPWAQVVRGADSEPLNNQSSPPQPPPQSSSSSSLDSANLVAAAAITAVAAIAVDNTNADKNNNNAGNPKKHAWKNASNGVVAEVSPVMGAVSWPALSAKSSAKLTSDSSSAVAEGSISIPQGPITSNSPRKQATITTNTNANTKSTPPMNHGATSRQKPMKRGGVNNSSNETAPFPMSFSNPPHVNLQDAPPPYPVVQIPNTGFADGVQSYRNNNGWSPRSPVGGYGLPVDEHRNSSRRGNYGNRPHNNSGIRRNQDSGNNVNTRDAHAHQHRMHPGGFLRPTLHNSPSYFGSPSMRPFVNTFGFHEFYYYPTLQFEQFGGMPFLTHAPPPAMFFPVPETPESPAETTSAELPLTSLILKQIEYYFSDVNLVKDDFLKSNMDEQGWVPITLIANFPRVKKLTNNIELILDSMRTSKVVEVHGDKMRRRNELMRCLPSAHQHQLASSGSVSPSGSSCNNIVADFDKITLDEATGHKISNATTNVGSA